MIGAYKFYDPNIKDNATDGLRKKWSVNGPPVSPPSLSSDPVRWDTDPSSSRFSKTLGFSVSKIRTPSTPMLPRGISLNCSQLTVVGSSILASLPCSLLCICGGKKIPASPNSSIDLMTHRRRSLPPFYQSPMNGWPPWPPPPSSHQIYSPMTAQIGTVSSSLTILGRLGNPILSPSIVQ